MLNKIMIQGRLTRDPELRKTTNDTSVVTISIAVDRGGKDKGADFFDVVAWRHTAEFIRNYFHKGSQILVDGKLSTREYVDRDGNKRKVVEITADNVHFCGTANNAQTEPDFPTIDLSSGGYEEVDVDLPF